MVASEQPISKLKQDSCLVVRQLSTSFAVSPDAKEVFVANAWYVIHPG